MALLFKQHLASLSPQQALPQGGLSPRERDMKLKAKVLGELCVLDTGDKMIAPSSHFRLTAVSTVNHSAGFCWNRIDG